MGGYNPELFDHYVERELQSEPNPYQQYNWSEADNGGSIGRDVCFCLDVVNGKLPDVDKTGSVSRYGGCLCVALQNINY